MLKPQRPTSDFLHDAIHTKPANIFLDISGSTPPNLFSKDELIVNSALQYDERAEVIARLTDKTLDLLQLDKSNHAITFSVGSSQAFTQTLATITKPGDTVVIEKPNYEPFIKTAQLLNLKIKYFTRTGDANTDEKDLNKHASKSRVLILTNPNFPLGSAYQEETLRRFTKKFKFAIIDEVFLPQFTFNKNNKGRATQFTAQLPANTFVTGSYAKSIGLGALRLGWVASNKKYATALARMAYHFHIEMPVGILLAGEKGLDRWQPALERLEKMIAPNRALLRNWVSQDPTARETLFSHDLSTGNFALLKVGNSKKFTQALIKEGVFVKDGALMGMPKHVRISWAADPALFAKAWQKIIALLKI
jgi:histidinol-phosphate aminotransferase